MGLRTNRNRRCNQISSNRIPFDSDNHLLRVRWSQAIAYIPKIITIITIIIIGEVDGYGSFGVIV